MSNLRRVPLTDEPVVFVPSRDAAKGGAKCPFCPGNETQTRAEVAAFRDGGDAGDSHWRVRAFANISPIVEAPHGAHEVIVDDRRHDVVISSESLQMYRDRFSYHEQQQSVNAIALFKNVGSVAGASIEHPHAQLVALGETPPRLRRMWANAWAHHRDSHECYWCALLDGEKIYSNGTFSIVRSPVPRFAGEMLVIPKRHQPTFADLSAHDASTSRPALVAEDEDSGRRLVM